VHKSKTEYWQKSSAGKKVVWCVKGVGSEFNGDDDVMRGVCVCVCSQNGKAGNDDTATDRIGADVETVGKLDE
jgi:hypothetical protein